MTDDEAEQNVRGMIDRHAESRDATEKALREQIEELKWIGMELVDALATKPDTDLKVKILQRQVRMLADRLALASCVFRDMELACGIEGDAEGADEWERLHRMLLGRDNRALAAARADRRKWGEYKLGLVRVREFLKLALPKRAQKKPEAAKREAA